MYFNSGAYILFLIVVLSAYYLVGRRGAQNFLLLAGSWFFYGFIHPWFLWLLAAVTGTAYLAALGIRYRPAGRRVFLWLGVGTSLAVLGAFKYFNFFVSNVDAVLTGLGLPATSLYLYVILPVGISFYTFQAIAYIVDVYRGDQQAERNPVEVALFLSFFPQLIAGPIERASTLLAQVQRPRPFDAQNITAGLMLMSWGFVKKLVIGDNAAVIVNKIFLLQEPGPALLTVGVLAFAVQIYADFSGYTDIARGSARLLGFRLSENFRHPYLAQSAADFWRRWHITLSEWIRDYIYLPLGGQTGSRWRQFGVVMVAFFFTGLWHGAQWNFVLWGVFHGLLVFGYRLVGAAGVPLKGGSSLAVALRISVMFFLVGVSWALFRESDLTYLAYNFNPFNSHADAPEAAFTFYMLILTTLYALPLIAHAILDTVRERGGLHWWPPRLAFPGQLVFTVTALLAALVLRSNVATDFIYFQF